MKNIFYFLLFVPLLGYGQLEIEGGLPCSMHQSGMGFYKNEFFFIIKSESKSVQNFLNLSKKEHQNLTKNQKTTFLNRKSISFKKKKYRIRNKDDLATEKNEANT